LIGNRIFISPANLPLQLLAFNLNKTLELEIVHALISHSFPIHIMCDVDVKSDCFADEARDFQVPCNYFKPNLSGICKSSCEHALKYVYTVTNSGSGSEAVSGITTVMQDGTKKNILQGPFDLEPDETMEFTDVMIVDYCEKDFPNGMNTSIEVMGE
jgi:hypothetical protein